MANGRRGSALDAPPTRAELTATDEYERLRATRLEHLVPVDQPLILISQVQRSGGTLLSQLFDAHPECHAHPYELKIGHPGEKNWPVLDLSAPATWFDVLWEKKVVQHFFEGYRKPGEGTRDVADTYPFLFLPRLQRHLFDACTASRPIETDRDVLDCYFTSYFNAWLDNVNLYATPKRYVTGFTPRLVTVARSVEGFFATYPDGFLVSIVRDPRSWYTSARLHDKKYAEVERGLEIWKRSAESALAARERYGERVVVLTFDDLVRDTEATMRRLCRRVGLSYSELVAAPTFNGRPMRANSSHAVDGHGVLADRATTHRDLLDAETTRRVDEIAGDLYERAQALAATV